MDDSELPRYVSDAITITVLGNNLILYSQEDYCILKKIKCRLPHNYLAAESHYSSFGSLWRIWWGLHEHHVKCLGDWLSHNADR
jgi:hypothetical protein